MSAIASTAPLQPPPPPAQAAPQGGALPSNAELEEKMKYFAPFAKSAYGAPKGNDAMPGFHIDSRFSNENRVLYASDTDPKKAILSFRGTDVTNKHDLGTDALLALHMEGLSSRFQNASRAAKAAQSEYSDLTLTGHSLGGSQALYAAKSLKTPPSQVVAFSPHESWFQSIGDKFRAVHDMFFKPKERQPSNSYIYKTDLDPVSAFVSPHYNNSTVVTVKQQGLNPHGLTNFE
jgi:hypothetical protein